VNPVTGTGQTNVDIGGEEEGQYSMLKL